MISKFRKLTITGNRQVYATRRSFLKTIAGTASLGLADVTSLAGLRALADEKAPVPDTVRFGPEIEPIVRLIEDTPGNDCVRVLIEQLQKGLPYRRLLAGVFFAGIRRLNSYHDVYKIHSVHQVSTQLRPEERLLPLFWAVDGFKTRQQDWPSGPLTELSGPLPNSTEAAAELAGALETADLEAVEKALIVLARNRGIPAAREQLWLYGCRNGGAGGHGRHCKRRRSGFPALSSLTSFGTVSGRHDGPRCVEIGKSGSHVRRTDIRTY